MGGAHRSEAHMGGAHRVALRVRGKNLVWVQKLCFLKLEPHKEVVGYRSYFFQNWNHRILGRLGTGAVF